VKQRTQTMRVRLESSNGIGRMTAMPNRQAAAAFCRAILAA
jgi:hypothetical protein